MEDGQALERQVGVDGVDAVERARPRRGGQAAGQDGPDVGRRDVVGVGELGADPREQAGGERLVAEDRAGLHGAHRVPPDRPVRGAQLDPWQLGGPCRERLEPELEARRDRAADVGPVGGDAVERRRRPEVDDDGRRAVQPRRREGIDQPVGTDVARPVDPDGERDGAGLATSSGRSRRSAIASTAPVSAGTTERQRDRVEVAERDPVEPQQPVEQELDLVGRRPRRSSRRGASRAARRRGTGRP